MVGDNDHLEVPACVLAPKSTLGQLAVEEVDALRLAYSKMYTNIPWNDCNILTTFKKFSHMSWHGK